jgi:hypothetical protein
MSLKNKNANPEALADTRVVVPMLPFQPRN